jgi:hypothetical protein
VGVLVEAREDAVVHDADDRQEERVVVHGLGEIQLNDHWRKSRAAAVQRWLECEELQ